MTRADPAVQGDLFDRATQLVGTSADLDLEPGAAVQGWLPSTALPNSPASSLITVTRSFGFTPLARRNWSSRAAADGTCSCTYAYTLGALSANVARPATMLTCRPWTKVCAHGDLRSRVALRLLALPALRRRPSVRTRYRAQSPRPARCRRRGSGVEYCRRKSLCPAEGASQLEPARATRRIGRDDLLSMLCGDDSLQALEEAFDLVQSQTDAVAGTHVHASLDRRNLPAPALAAGHNLDVNLHFTAPFQQLEARSCQPPCRKPALNFGHSRAAMPCRSRDQPLPTDFDTSNAFRQDHDPIGSGCRTSARRPSPSAWTCSLMRPRPASSRSRPSKRPMTLQTWRLILLRA